MIRISVIVPIRNESRSIAKTLNALSAQNRPFSETEILVVDGGSTDNTWSIVEDLAKNDNRIRLLENPLRWSSAARNVGVKQAKGDFILIVDGHCELTDPEYLNHLVRAFETSGADCLGRPQPQDISQASPVQLAIAAARSSPIGHHPDSHIYSDQPGFVPAHSVAVSYRRRVFEQVGLFDESFDACEDVELNHRIDRAGLKCWFAPELIIRYEPRKTLQGLYRQLVRYGRGRVRLLRKHPDTWSLKTMVPAIFVAGLPAGLVASACSNWLAWAFSAIMILYAAIIIIGSVAAAKGVRTRAAWPWIPLVLITIHVASGVGQWQEILFPIRRNPFANPLR